MRRYLIAFAATATALLALVAAFTVALDPYDFWGTPRVAGWNAKRSAGGGTHDLVKMRQYPRAAPTIVIAGNSRVEVGFDPDAPGWPLRGAAYNYGLPGKAMRGLVPELLSAIDAHRPSALFVGVDFVDYPLSEAEWRAPRRVIAPAPRDAGARLHAAAEATLSFAAVRDGLRSALSQKDRDAPLLTPLGVNPLAEYPAEARRVGYAALFAQRDRENFTRYARLPRAVRWPVAGGSANLDALNALARGCRARGVRLVLFTYPYHEHVLIGLRRYGLWPALLDFRRALADVGAAERVAVVDFTRLDGAPATEPVPAPGDRRAVTRWYWEAGHFKPALGARMMTTLAGAAGLATRPGAAGLAGAPLTPATVAADNAALTAGVERAARGAAGARLAPVFAAVDRRARRAAVAAGQ